MIAVDTNVVVRALTRDDPTQAARAAALFSSDQVWISETVLPESLDFADALPIHQKRVPNELTTLIIGLTCRNSGQHPSPRPRACRGDA